jgi:hypothetical protein
MICEPKKKRSSPPNVGILDQDWIHHLKLDEAGLSAFRESKRTVFLNFMFQQKRIAGCAKGMLPHSGVPKSSSHWINPAT